MVDAIHRQVPDPNSLEQVTGKLNTGFRAAESLTFFKHTISLWSRTTVDLASPSRAVDVRTGKLRGHYSWSFKIPIPDSVILEDPVLRQREFRLPQTFVERQTRVSVRYDLCVQITRGLFRADSLLVFYEIIERRAF